MKKLLLLLLIVFTSVSYGQTFEELVSSAADAKEEKNFRESINLYNKALELDENNHNIYNKLSLLHFYLGDADSSILYCNKTLEIVPDDSTALYQRGHCYLSLGSYRKALDDFIQAFELTDLKNSHGSFNIGKCYFGLGDLYKAIEFFELTLKLEPNDKYSFFQLGYCYASFSSPEKDKALHNYNEAIKLDSNYYDAYFNRGLLYATQYKNSKQGHSDLERSIEIWPENKYSYLYNGILYREEDDLGNSKDTFDKLIEIYPDFADAYFQRAFTWYNIGILNMVCKDLEKADTLGHKEAAENQKNLCK